MEQDNFRTQHEEQREAQKPREPGQEPLVPRCEVKIGAAQGKQQHQRRQENDAPSNLPDRVAEGCQEDVH